MFSAPASLPLRSLIIPLASREPWKHSGGRQPMQWPADFLGSGSDTTEVGRMNREAPGICVCIFVFLDDPFWSINNFHIDLNPCGHPIWQ